MVEQLAQGDVSGAIQKLEQQGRVHEFKAREERIEAIAKEYAKSPENTLVVSPDNLLPRSEELFDRLPLRGI